MPRCLLFLTIFIFGFGFVFANDSEDQIGPPKFPWNFGVGVVHLRRAYRDAGNRTIPLPFISYSGEHFFFLGLAAGVQMPVQKIFTIGVQARYRLAGYDPDDSAFLTGMAKRKDTIELGGLLRVRLPHKFTIALDYLADAANHHRGQEWDISLRRPIRQGGWTFIPSVGVDILSSNMADYYFGVERSEATAFRPDYEVPASENWKGGLTVLHRFTENFFAMVSYSLERLDADIKRSPLVERKTTSRLMAGITYKL